MKILSVLRAIPPEGAAWWRVWNIWRLLRVAGHEVHFVYYSERHSSAYPVTCRSISDCLLAEDSPITVHLANLKLILKERYDLIYGNLWSGAFCSILGKLVGVPLVFDMHGSYVEEFKLESGYLSSPPPRLSFALLRKEMVESASLRFSDKIVCVSKSMTDYLHRKKKVPLGKMAYVTNGVDLEFFRPTDDGEADEIRAELGIRDELVFGYVGGFQRYQGVDNFIQAAQTVDDQELAFLTVGEKRETNSERVTSIPEVQRSSVPAYYSACDVLVLPRPRHPATEIAAPTKFGEYVAMGKPVLTTDVGDASDFVRDSGCGIVVPDNSVEGLLEGIMEFKSVSENELRIMGRNSRTLAEREFDWKKVGTNLLAAIESLN